MTAPIHAAPPAPFAPTSAAHPPAADAVRDAVGAALRRDRPVLLAVSGGLDSMVLLDAAAAHQDIVVAVATFDHGSGRAAADAVEHVRREVAARGLPVIAGRAAGGASTEAAWRAARWAFLRDTAARVGAVAIATAHTRDDQVETVAMRLLRGAGARGLAGLYADSADVVRPFVDLERAMLATYAAAHDVRWVEDPTNLSTRHRRNRMRLDLLPVLRSAHPAIDDELLGVALKAAAWRREVRAFVDAHVALKARPDGTLHVATAGLAQYDADQLAVLWPEVAARAGVRLDRRGTARLVAFTMKIAAGAAVGAEIQLSGPVDVVAGRGEIVLRHRRAATPSTDESEDEQEREVPLEGDVALDRWRLVRNDAPAADSLWKACLPVDRPLTVRRWRAGDRMRVKDGQAARRVKRYFADARVPGPARRGWPVVLAGGEIVWIPGVRRSDAATDRPGRPGVHFLCERIDG